MRRALGGLLLVLPMLAAQGATYKWIDADGRVNYGDRPPEGVNPQQVALPTRPIQDTGEAALPLPLRNVTARHPVILYSTNPCGACDLARSHLVRRGIPHSERTIRTAQDLDAFGKLGFTGMALPVVLVGRERLNGYDAERLDRFLDTVGYPKVSLMPPNWRPAAASQLAPANEPDPLPSSAATEGTRPETPTPQPFTTLRPGPTPPPASSTGIRF